MKINTSKKDCKMKKKQIYQYILGIQCFATIDSGASIIRVKKKL